MRFGDILGQERAVGLLTAAIATGRLAHACLFDGPDGVGKRSAAIGLALAMACPEDPGKGCGTCDTCRRMLAGQHPDLLVMGPQGTSYVVEQAREIVALASDRPHEAPCRVIVLDKADSLNPASANCLLKTLEEPFPGNYLILVTSSPDRLLPTIRSRLQRMRFAGLSPEVLVDLALRHGADQSRAEIAAALASGQASRLFGLLEKGQENDLWTLVTHLRKAASAHDISSIFNAAAGFAEKESRENLPEALALLARFYRDVLAKVVAADDLIVLRDRSDELYRLADGAMGKGAELTLARAVGQVLKADSALSGNMNAVTVLEKMLMELRRLEELPA